MQPNKTVIGWIGVSISALVSSIWAYWGAFENFHEGWYSVSIWENIFMMLFQYLIFTIVFIILALVSLKWRKIGLAAHLLLGGFCIWFFSGASFSVLGLLIIIPFAVLGVLYYFGEPKPKKWAYRIIVIIPLTIIIAISIPLGIKTARRVDDGDFGSRTVAGNGVTLTWAPKGPGWPEGGVAWEEAQDICRYLSEDGLSVMDTPQDIWCLPTVDEAVRSMMLHSVNAGGVWDAEAEKAVYEMTPDKETPLWEVHSNIIYYWTADTAAEDESRAYIIVYNGGVFDRRKAASYGYLSFRAVKDAG